jgi:uncharacterized membrane protein YccC
MVFWITVILGLMFGMLGFFAPELLLLRLEETAVGAACGGAVASLVLLRQKRVPVEDAVRAFLQALGHSVDDAAHALLDGTPPPDLANRIVMAEQRFRDLSAIAQAERLGLATRNEALRRRVLVLEGCELWARELGQIGLQSVNPLDPGLATLVRKTVARIDAAVIEANDSATNRSATDDQPAGALVPAPGDDLPRAVRLLLRIEAALVHFASR